MQNPHACLSAVGTSFIPVALDGSGMLLVVTPLPRPSPPLAMLDWVLVLGFVPAPRPSGFGEPLPLVLSSSA